MHARWPAALALLGSLALSTHAAAQGQASAGRGAGQQPRGRVAHPGPPSPQPSVRGPFRVIVTTPPPGVPRDHRPLLLRSPVLGLFFFDPYWWLGPDVGAEIVAPPIPLSGPQLSGGLQLDVEPRRALVYVDGVLAGTVDQFKGYFQHLETSAGYHIIQFVAPDYEPLTAGVTVVPNRTTTYRASLNRANGR